MSVLNDTACGVGSRRSSRKVADVAVARNRVVAVRSVKNAKPNQRIPMMRATPKRHRQILTPIPVAMGKRFIRANNPSFIAI